MTGASSRRSPREFAFAEISEAADAVQEIVSAIVVVSRGLLAENERRGSIFVATELNEACDNPLNILRQNEVTLCG